MGSLCVAAACAAVSTLCGGCLRWGCYRCSLGGSADSSSWPNATATDFSPVPRLSRIIQYVYEEDTANLRYTPDGGYQMDVNNIVKTMGYKDVQGSSPPYIIYVDHEHREIVLAMRGLHAGRKFHYDILLNNNPPCDFEDGFVHKGMFLAAGRVFEAEKEFLKENWERHGREYDLVFTGHSLGSGIASMLTLIAVTKGEDLGGFPRSKVRCFAISAARSMSLNLAIKYADIIFSVVLQDDFLARTAKPVEEIIGATVSLPGHLCMSWLKDILTSDEQKIRNPTRLYPPGRMYHIVERKSCRCCWRYPPEVRTSIPVDGRFERIIFSCSTGLDHEIAWVIRESEKALELMRLNGSSSGEIDAPALQRMEREKEHRAAVDRAIRLKVPNVAPYLGYGEEAAAIGGGRSGEEEVE